MQTNNHHGWGQQKTLGPQAARLLAVLHEKRRAIFTVGDVQEVTGLGPKSTRNFVGKLVQRGVATRLKPGLFILVPFELGREREYLGNPYLVARALAGGRDYYLSHVSAMDAHRMVTQPQLVVYVTSPLPLRGRTILGAEFRFVRCKAEHLFGVAEHWVDKTEKVLVSDLERTVIDGLKQPEYCGGIVEVAKGYWMRRGDMNIGRLVDYALRLDVGAVIRRLGFLLETCGVVEPAALAPLRARLTATYHLLDPTLPAEGHRVARWRLRLNVSPEELEAVRST
ncbi:MAG: transcriptional regulator [Deltaproteobacteria bacterium]|nr:transcriptional regulator [Deltaproteobacteria bacterium]